MSEKSHVYEAWNESVISEEKGNRIIHFYLRSTTASPLLAAVATEKAGRHFIYTVSKDYLETFEPSPGINAHTKWTSKEPVTDWLVSLVRKDNLPPTKPDLHLVSKQEGGSSSMKKANSLDEVLIMRFPKKPRTRRVRQRQDSCSPDEMQQWNQMM